MAFFYNFNKFNKKKSLIILFKNHFYSLFPLIKQLFLHVFQ